MNPKKLRILFVDDEAPQIITTFKEQGYDVEHKKDIDNLDNIADGRYHIIFMDIRGVGTKLGGNGLDAIKYIATHNPMIYRIVFSAKPLYGEDGETVRKYANKLLKKDVTFYDAVEELELYAASIDKKWIISQLSQHIKLGWWSKLLLSYGKLSKESAIHNHSKAIGNTAESLKIAANITSIALSLLKIYTETN